MFQNPSFNPKSELNTFAKAEDLKKSQEDAGLADTLKLVYEANHDKLEVFYGKLIPILVKAIQELSHEIEILKIK